jgi:RING-box protein 1
MSSNVIVNVKNMNLVTRWTFGFQNETCPICRNHLDEINPGKKATEIHSQYTCGHAFHSECILTWINQVKSHSCPVCNQALIKK